MPPWMAVANKYLGTKEYPGAANNPVILGWAKRLGGWFASFYKADSIPWCGLFVADCMKESGLPVHGDALSALGWADYGVSCEPAVGAIMVFKRPGGGHVGFYVAEDATAYHILGGNQSDAVTIARVEKSRCVNVRWPSDQPKSTIGRNFKIGKSPVSRNEA